MTLTFRFSPCVCTVVSRLNEFSYDGIPKDGAFLTPAQGSAPVPGQKIFCPRQSVTVTSPGFRPEILSRERNGNFRRSFVSSGSQLAAWRRARVGKLSWPTLITLAGKCGLRLGFPVPGPGVQAESQEAHVTMSPCQCLCPQSRPQSNLISGHRRTPASQIKSALDKEISHSKTAEYKLLELRVELRV